MPARPLPPCRPGCLDVAGVAEHLRDILEATQLLPRPDVHEAIDGEDALATLARGGVDLVITDVVMPRMDGLTLCRRLDTDKRLSDPPVVLLTRESEAALEAREYIRNRE